MSELFSPTIGDLPAGAGAEALRPWAGGGDLLLRYEAYCRDQARLLLGLIPRTGIRKLLREARRWDESRWTLDVGGPAGRPAPVETDDPLSLLERYAREILPLPPLSAWYADFRKEPVAHLEASIPGRAGEVHRSPVLVARRRVEDRGSGWSCDLLVFPSEGGAVWRGFITFGLQPDAPTHRTADIFRGGRPGEIRDRFSGLESSTLLAFLRSVLP